MILKLPLGAGAQVSLPPASDEDASKVASPAWGLLVKTRYRCFLPSSLPLTVLEPDRGTRRPLRLRREGETVADLFQARAQLSARTQVQDPELFPVFNQPTNNLLGVCGLPRTPDQYGATSQVLGLSRCHPVAVS